MRALRISLLAAVALAARAVAADQSTYFFPLSDGAEWIMDAKLISPNGNVVPTIAHRAITGQVQRNGKTYFRLQTWMDFGPDKKKFTKLVREDETGVYSIEEGNKNAAEQKEVPFPLGIGLSWQRTSHDGVTKDQVVEMKTITIGDNSYQYCLHFRSAAPDHKFVEDYWNAPNVGSVRSVMTFANGAKIVLTLREFRPGR